MRRRLPFERLQKVLPTRSTTINRRRATAKSISARTWQPTTSYNISGLILAVSRSRAVPSFKRPSLPCSDGTGMQRNVTYTCRMWQSTTNNNNIRGLRHDQPGNSPFVKADGSPGDGHCKSFSPRAVWSSSPRVVTGWAAGQNWINSYKR